MRENGGCMARLKQVSPDTAQGDLKNVFESIKKRMGTVPNVFQYMANSPSLLKGFFALAELANATQLSPRMRQLILLTVSQNNNCQYCLSAHSYISKNLGLEEKEILEARKAQSKEPKTHALLQFCKKFVEKKGFIDDNDINHLKSQGISDAEIGDALLVIILGIYTNYFNHLNNTPIDFPEAVRLEEVASHR